MVPHKIVFSYWRKPLYENSCIESRAGFTTNDRNEAMMWALSTCLVNKHHGQAHLVADQESADWLVNKVGIKFASVNTKLDSALIKVDPRFSVAGKIAACSGHFEPFIHLDYDFFLWKPLPSRVLNAEICAQKVLQGPREKCGYFWKDSLSLPYLPNWWQNAAKELIHYPIHAGLLGGSSVAAISRWSNDTLHTIARDENKAFHQNMLDDVGQKYLSLFDEWAFGAATKDLLNRQSLHQSADSFNFFAMPSVENQDVPFSHLVGSCTKQMPHNIAAIQNCLQSFDPEAMSRINKLFV